VDSPLTKMARFALTTQPIIHLIILWLKPVWARISVRKSQSMQSKSFLRSNLRMRAFEFFNLILCIHSWAVPVVSRIWQPFKNPSCYFERKQERKGLIPVAIILEMSL
jgi:hypothetical protein